MTMFSSENRRFICGGGGGIGYGGGSIVYGEGLIGVMSQLQGYGLEEAGSDPVVAGPMGEDESRTESLNESSSKDHRDNDDDHQGWLQLSIGGHHSRSHLIKNDDQDEKNNSSSNNNRRSSSSLVELELMPSSSNNSSNNNNNNTMSHSQIRPEMFQAPRPMMMSPTGFSPSPTFFFPGSCSNSSFNPRQEFNWAFRAPMIPINNIAPSANSSSLSSTSSSLMGPGSYFSRPFQLYPGVDMAAGPGPGADFRVIQPPRRPHSGIWFMLQASQNQEKEPFLPQIPKSYLRIKDGRMTIRLVIKYLVNKLRLENESEIEITCKGQRLLPFLTLQHVRDNIWSSPRDFITLLPNSSTTHHIMVLHYARTASN